MRRSAFLSLAVVAIAIAIAMGPVPAGAASPAPAASAAPSPVVSARPDVFFPIAAGTSAMPTGLDWQPVGPEPRKNSWMSLLTTWDGGFAVVDDGVDRSVVRTSSDGASWATGRLPRAQGWYREMVAFDGGLALLSSTYSEGPGASMRFDVWRSEDGLAWERAGGLVVRPPTGCLAGVGDLSVVDGRLLVMGTLCFPPCCGAGPGPALALMGDRVLAAATPVRRVVAWSSRDGRRWQRQPVRVIDSDGRAVRIASLVTVDAARGGLLAVPEYGPAAIITSADGLTWTELAPFPDGYTPWGDTEPRTAVASGALLVGQDETGAGIWRLEPDLSTWSRAVSSVEETEVYGMATDGATVLVSGVVRESYSSRQSFAWTLVSIDGGVTWDSSLAWAGALGSCVRGVAIHAGVAVMVSCTDGRAALWRAELATP